MGDDRDTNLSAAFDALLEQNWQRLDALSGSRRRPSQSALTSPGPGAASVPPAVDGGGQAGQGGRRQGRCDGLKFSFDV